MLKIGRNTTAIFILHNVVNVKNFEELENFEGSPMMKHTINSHKDTGTAAEFGQKH